MDVWSQILSCVIISSIRFPSRSGTIIQTEIHGNAEHGLVLFGEFAEVDFQGSIYNNINSLIENIWGAGVNCYNGTFTLRESSAIYNNRAGIGGGARFDNSFVVAIGSEINPKSISYNVAEKNGEGIYLSEGNWVEKVNVRIDANTASNQGGGT